MISVPQVKEEQYSLVMEFYLDQNCLFTLDKAFINEIYFEDKVITTSTSSSTTTPSTTTTTTPPNTTTTTPPTETKPAEVKPEEKIEKVKKERRTNCIIKLVNCTYGVNPSLLTSMIQRESAQENEDKNLIYAKEKRNELETFMYTTKENLTTILVGFYDVKEAENLNTLMAQTENWMYNNVEETYLKEKIEEYYNLVTVPGNRIYRRKTHWENIDKGLNDAKASLGNNIQRFENHKGLLITVESDELTKVVQQFNDFYNNTLPICIKSPKFIDPPFDYVNIEKQTKEFNEKVNKIFSDADKRIKEAEKKLQEEKKKQEEAAAKSNAPNTNGEKMQVD